MFLAGKLKPIPANNGFAFGGPWRQRKETIEIKTIFGVHDRADCKLLKDLFRIAWYSVITVRQLFTDFLVGLHPIKPMRICYKLQKNL